MLNAPGDRDFEWQSRRVYYSGLWYTRGAFPGSDSLTCTAVKSRIDQALDDLQLLALVYDEIYVPRSHFLTSFHEAHRDFLTGVVQSTEFKWLKDNAVLVSSVSPQTDAIADTDRICQRSGRLRWLRPSASKADRQMVASVPTIKIDSKAEAASSLAGYHKIATTLARARNAKQFPDVVSGSEYRDIEFFHERFLNLLRGADASMSVKEEFWRATNEIYLSNTGAELGTVVVPYDSTIEPRLPRRNAHGKQDSRLFNTDTLRMILNTLIDSRSVAAWLEKRIDHALAFRCDLNSSEWKRWKGFQSAYFDLLEAIDEVLFAMQKSHGAELPDVRAALVAEITTISDRWGGDAVSAAVQAAGGLAQLADPTAGVAARTGAAGASGLLNRLVKNFLINNRYGPIASFLKRTMVKG